MLVLNAAFLLLASIATSHGQVVINANMLAHHLYRQPTTNVFFSIDCTVSLKPRGAKFLAVEDDTGAAIVQVKDPADEHFSPGDRIHITGFTYESHPGHYTAHCTETRIAGHGAPPEPTEATIEGILTGQSVSKSNDVI